MGSAAGSALCAEPALSQPLSCRCAASIINHYKPKHFSLLGLSQSGGKPASSSRESKELQILAHGHLRPGSNGRGDTGPSLAGTSPTDLPPPRAERHPVAPQTAPSLPSGTELRAAESSHRRCCRHHLPAARVPGTAGTGSHLTLLMSSRCEKTSDERPRGTHPLLGDLWQRLLLPASWGRGRLHLGCSRAPESCGVTVPHRHGCPVLGANPPGSSRGAASPACASAGSTALAGAARQREIGTNLVTHWLSLPGHVFYKSPGIYYMITSLEKLN